MHDKAVQLVAHLDLARKPRIRPAFPGKIQHVFFHDVGLADGRFPGVIDIDMAGGTRTGATAFRLDPRYGVLYGIFHDGRTVGSIHDMALAVMRHIGNLCQGRGSEKNWAGDPV